MGMLCGWKKTDYSVPQWNYPNAYVKPLCGTNIYDLKSGLQEGEHNLTLRVMSRDNPFFLDHIQILPLSDINHHRPNTPVVVNPMDAAVEYSGNLVKTVEGLTCLKSGGSLSLNFTGGLSLNIVADFR